jgi:hypothetical protein
MSTESVVREAIDAFNRHRFEAVMGIFEPDCEFVPLRRRWEE